LRRAGFYRKTKEKGMIHSKFGQILFRAALILTVAVGLAALVNAGRPTPIDWIAQADYEIYEDCEETTESAEPVALAEVSKHPDWYLVVDARDPEAFEADHLEGAYSMPYDPLFGVGEEEISAIRDEAGDRSIVVVGEGEFAKLLADDLLSGGLSWVQYLEEGEDWRSLAASEKSE